MEDEVLELSKEDLQDMVREGVKERISKWCDLLQNLINRREKQADKFLELTKSVEACETIMKKQYSLLGLSYTDGDSDEDNRKGNSGGSSPQQNGHVHSETQATCGSSSTLFQKLQMLQQKAKRDNAGEDELKPSVCLKRKAVVVLDRLPAQKVRRLCSVTPKKPVLCSDNESANNSDCDPQWEPQEPSSDESNVSLWSDSSASSKKRKTVQTKLKFATNTNNKSNAVATTAAAPAVNGNADVQSDASETSTPPVENNVTAAPPTVTALCQSSDKAAKTPPPRVPLGEILVNMNVLARRKAMSWKQGKVIEIITKEDGRVKHKINFDEKGKSLVSGHHIAFACMPKVEQLNVGVRVVVKSQDDPSCFCPGILVEIPNRKNRMRFLVFRDDHTPCYVSLPLIHVVCRPLEDPLEDIPDVTHRKFMREYLKVWPYPPLTQYRLGQKINVEVNGFQESCTVQIIDGSLVKVVFEKDDREEWIYRGSMRLEHMASLRKHLNLKTDTASKATDKETSQSNH